LSDLLQRFGSLTLKKLLCDL